jgi:hypothetical protein
VFASAAAAAAAATAVIAPKEKHVMKHQVKVSKLGEVEYEI